MNTNKFDLLPVFEALPSGAGCLSYLMDLVDMPYVTWPLILLSCVLVAAWIYYGLARCFAPTALVGGKREGEDLPYREIGAKTALELVLDTAPNVGLLGTVLALCAQFLRASGSPPSEIGRTLGTGLLTTAAAIPLAILASLSLGLLRWEYRDDS